MSTYTITIEAVSDDPHAPNFSATFDSPADTLTLARTVCEAIQSIPKPPKGRKTRSDAGKTRNAATT